MIKGKCDIISVENADLWLMLSCWAGRRAEGTRARAPVMSMARYIDASAKTRWKKE